MIEPEILSTKLLFETPRLKTFEREIKTGEKHHKWTFVSRQQEPQNAKEKRPDAVVIVALTKDYLPVLIKEWRAPLGDWEIGFPAGMIEEGQTPEQAAVREMKEETGLDLEVWGVSPNLFSSAGMTNESFVYVFGEATGNISSDNLQGDEHLEVLFFEDWEEVRAMLNTGAVSARAWPILMSDAITLVLGYMPDQE